MTHTLKVETSYYSALVSGDKTFEIRFNDRGYQKGDVLHLLPWSAEFQCYIEPYDGILKTVTYVYSGLGMQENYVCLGIK